MKHAAFIIVLLFMFQASAFAAEETPSEPYPKNCHLRCQGWVFHMPPPISDDGVADSRMATNYFVANKFHKKRPNEDWAPTMEAARALVDRKYKK